MAASPAPCRSPAACSSSGSTRQSPYHKDFFASGNRFVFFCAGGWRSALAAKTAQDMGLTPVCHIKGGFGAWAKAGAPTEKVEPKPAS